MKTKLFFLSALLLALLGVCGCSGEDEDGLINSQPAVLHYLLIKDAKGMDLLNPGNPSGFKNNEITLEYRTASVHPFIISSEAIVDQRSMQPIYFELRFIAEFSSYVLVLGGFDTSLPFKKEFIIHWPDDTSDSFCAENMYKNQGYDYSLRVNGVEQGNVVELRK